MKISTRGRYGLKAMVDLAENYGEKCVPLSTIAKRQGLSENYLEQLIAPLKKAGFVKSVRGAQGGYILNKPPMEISVGDILEVLEGSLSPVDCVEGGAEDTAAQGCGTVGCKNCTTKTVWEKIYDSINEVLSGISLYSLITENNQTELKED